MFAIPADEAPAIGVVPVEVAPTRVEFLTALRTGVDAQDRDDLTPEVDDVLRGSHEFQKFVVAGGFQATRLQLVANLGALLVLGLVVEVVLQLTDEFDALAQPIHDQLLAAERLHPDEFVPFLLLDEFSEDVLLLATEPLLLNAIQLLWRV